MGNRKELRDARRRAADAVAELAAIEALPRRIGSRVRWTNGVIWERVGDDAWEPRFENDGYERHADHDQFYGISPSLHVTGIRFGHGPTWERVS